MHSLYTSTFCVLAPPSFRARARTFWFASQFLPARHRDPIRRLYAFARTIDDLVDEPLPSRGPDATRALLDAWRTWLDHPARGLPPDAALGASVRSLIDDHGLHAEYLQSLIDGVTSDLDRRALASWFELRGYCVQVASSVGLAVCDLLGSGADVLATDAAIELGIAMQLTNILRDVGADLRSNRLYLPADELADHGSSHAHLELLADRITRHGPRAMDMTFRNVMRAHIARARAHYARGVRGVARLPAESRFGIMLAARLYVAILDQIEAADFDVFTRRAATSTWFKLAMVLHCWSRSRVPSFAEPPSSGHGLVVHP